MAQFINKSAVVSTGTCVVVQFSLLILRGLVMCVSLEKALPGCVVVPLLLQVFHGLVMCVLLEKALPGSLGIINYVHVS